MLTLDDLSNMGLQIISVNGKSMKYSYIRYSPLEQGGVMYLCENSMTMPSHRLPTYLKVIWKDPKNPIARIIYMQRTLEVLISKSADLTPMTQTEVLKHQLRK